MNGEPYDCEEEAVEIGITAASEEISRQSGRGKRWGRWGEKEMLIADTAARETLRQWQRSAG